MSVTVPFITDIRDVCEFDLEYNFEYDELEYGINKNNNEENKNTDITNPFYVSQKGGNLKTITWGDIYRNFNSVIIMTLCDYMKPENIDIFFKMNIVKDELKNIKNITHFRTGINILKNKDHYFKSVIVNKDDLIQLFPDGNFNESEIVLSIFEMNESNTRKYCDMYKSSNDIQDIETKLDMYTYYLGDKKNLDYLNVELNDMFKNLKESDYWSDKKNLDINITTSFIDREFNNQRTSNSFQVINQNENKNFTNLNFVKNNDYPIGQSIKHLKKGKKDYPIDDIKNDIKNNIKIDIKDNVIQKSANNKIIKKKDLFVDPSAIIRKEKTNKKRTFFSTIIDNKNINNDYILNMYNMLNNDKLKYNFVNSLLVSKEYCHLILNNKNMLEQIIPMIEKYKHVFKYTIGYTWLNFYLEECLARTKSTKKSRFVFDINTANKLPVFPYIYSDIKQNPYITVLTDDVEILQDNTYGITYINGYDGYGVTDLATFQKRFNIFTTGNPDLNPFVGLDWSKFGVSGSAITACLQKRSILLDQIIKKNNNNETEGFKEFINKYYADSDVDLMSNDSSIVSFLDSVNTVYETLQKNINATPKETSFESVKTFAISITSYFFEYYLKDFNDTYGFNKTIQEFENMTDDILFKTYMYTKYINSKMLTNKKILNDNNKNNIFVKEYMIPNIYENMNIYKVDYANYETYDVQDSDVVYYRNDFGNIFTQKENHMVMKISENIRYKLFCKSTKIETFRIRDKEFFSTVARFHFPCVRAYYQGDNVYILPSCISAMMTGLNIEYKYFAGVRNPVDIINKYMQRGFGVLLNKFEINIWLEYNKNTENKTNIKFDGTDVDKKTLLGPKTLENKIYKIENPVPYNNIIKNTSDLEQYYSKYNKSSCINATKMKSINTNGNINKFHPSYVELCYDELN